MEGERNQDIQGSIKRLIRTAKLIEVEFKTSIHAAIGDNKLSVWTPWLAATQGMERFAGQNMTELAELTDKPKPIDVVLSCVWKETGDLLSECHLGLKDIRERDWDRILFWLRSSNIALINSQPMNTYIKQQTVLTYTTYWQ